MSYTSNDGVKIHYEIESGGPVLVLQHGFTQSLEHWAECGYVAPLQQKYRMILIDARGHGGSDKPHDETSYTLDRLVADVARNEAVELSDRCDDARLVTADDLAQVFGIEFAPKGRSSR